MPRITRKQQKVFAVDATNNGVFGSLQANDPVHSQDPDVIQSRTAYSNGWNDATYSAEKLPPLEEFQALQYLFSRQLAYLMQDGIAEWDTNTTYYKGSLVKAIQSDGSFILYASLVDNNQGNLVSDTTKWVITNTSTNFHQGIPNWRADVIYSEGDWVKSYNSSTGWMIYESRENSNLNNAVTDTDYWSPKPFTSEFPLLMHSWFDHEVDDTSWLRADTFSWQDGTVYTNAYNHLVDDIDGISPSTETVGSYTVTYYQATDGHRICMPDQETTLANIYNESGVAWYYVLDTANTRFKLPREKHGNIVEKYKNGKSWYRIYSDGWCEQGGFLYGDSDSNNKPVSFLKEFSDTNYSLNATVVNHSDSYSGSTGGATNDYVVVCSPLLEARTSSGFKVCRLSNNRDVYWTASGYISNVVENNQYRYLYFYVGQFSQTATEQTAGLNAELFNGKMDLDLGNVPTTSKETIVGWGMPDYTAGISVPLSSMPYTAPSNGIILVFWNGGNNELTINSQSISSFIFSGSAYFTGKIPFHVKKGDVISCSEEPITFYPCIGG